MNNQQSPFSRTHRPRSIGETQLAESAELGPDLCKSIHYQLFNLGHTPREVGIRYNVRDVEVVRVALQVERELAAKREEKAWVAGRRSLLTPRPGTAQRRIA